MSQVTKSARAIPRCRGCGEPTKGHAGPTGIARCQNQVVAVDINQNSNKNHGDTAVKAVKVIPTDLTTLKLASDSLVDKSDRNEEKLERHVGFQVQIPQDNDESLPFADPVLHKSIERCIATLSLEDNHKAREESKTIQEGEIDEMEHASEDVNSKRVNQCDNDDFLSQSTIEDLDSLLKIDEKTLIRKRIAPERVTSSSDNDVDIRKVLAGNSFQLCSCARSDGACGCNGLLKLSNDLEGDLENVFMDPLSEGETDFAPVVKNKKSSWKKNSPNEIILCLDSVMACGVSSSKGEIKMKALRFVEIIKGKKVLSVEVEAEIELSIRVNKLYTKRGYSSPMTFSNKFKLIQVKSLDDSNIEKSLEEDVPEEDSREEDVVFKKAEEKSAPAREPFVYYDESTVSKNGQVAYIPYDDKESATNKEDEDDCENGQEDELECGAADDIADEDLNEQDSDTEEEVDKDDTSDGDSDSASENKTIDESDNEEDDVDIGQTEDSLTEEESDKDGGSDEDGCEESWIEESLDSNDDPKDMNSESVDKN